MLYAHICCFIKSKETIYINYTSGGETAVTTSVGMLETSLLSDVKASFVHRFAFAVGDDLHLYGFLSYSALSGLDTESIELNGTQDSLFNDTQAIYLSLCDAGFSECMDNPGFDTLRIFISCNPTEYTLERSTFVFEGGEVSFDLRKGSRGA
jgi:hypothetical protein